jgi:hypothetical protein
MMKMAAATLCVLALAAAPTFGAGSSDDRAGHGRVVTLEPAAMGTLSFLPMLDILGFEGTDMFSYCTFTTTAGFNWRRSFFEFELPVPPDWIRKATLTLNEVDGTWSSVPFPTDVHEVSAYPGDGLVDVSDFDTPTVLVGTLETDFNDDPNLHVFEFDVTSVVQQFRKKIIGFRIKLQIDPDTPCTQLSAGSFFAGPFQYPPTLRLLIRGNNPNR